MNPRNFFDTSDVKFLKSKKVEKSRGLQRPVRQVITEAWLRRVWWASKTTTGSTRSVVYPRGWIARLEPKA